MVSNAHTSSISHPISAYERRVSPPIQKNRKHAVGDFTTEQINDAVNTILREIDAADGLMALSETPKTAPAKANKANVIISSLGKGYKPPKNRRALVLLQWEKINQTSKTVRINWDKKVQSDWVKDVESAAASGPRASSP